MGEQWVRTWGETLPKKAAAKMLGVSVTYLNKLITDGQNTSADIDKHVDDWIKTHQAEYDQWLADARAAAK